MNNVYKGDKLKLGEGEVFVFGSNLDGFHGAGSAGYATFNKFGNIWKEEGYDKLPNGTKGEWNIKGVGWGFQIGKSGMSYAVPTVRKAGAKKSFPLESIRKHIETFNAFAKGMPNYRFYIAQGAAKNLNGYSIEEMRKIWLDNIDWPDYVYFKEEFIL